MASTRGLFVVVAAALFGTALIGTALSGTTFARAREPAWPLSRGDGVAIAVVATDDALVARIRALAPGCAPVLVPIPSAGGAALADAIEEGARAAPRILLVAATEQSLDDETASAIARAAEAGALVLAPAGDEGLSHERSPADAPGALAVAAVDSSGALAATTNAGARTTVAARGESSFDAAALVAAASALAFAFDPSLRAADVRRALEAGPLVGRAAPRGAAPALVDPLAVLERLRPRSRLVALRDVCVVPPLARVGERVRVRLRALSAGRLPAIGPLALSVGGRPAGLLPFGPLSPGEAVALDATIVARAPSDSLPAGVTRTVDGGLVSASPLSVSVAGVGAAASASLGVIVAGERPPALRIVSVAVRRGLRASVVVENAGGTLEPSSVVRIVGAGGAGGSSGPVLAERAIARLEPGERIQVDLEGSIDSARLAPRLAVWLEAATRPRGVRETVHDRWPLVVDPAGARSPRRSSRR